MQLHQAYTYCMSKCLKSYLIVFIRIPHWVMKYIYIVVIDNKVLILVTKILRLFMSFNVRVLNYK